jgi:hypothetical protein
MPYSGASGIPRFQKNTYVALARNHQTLSKLWSFADVHIGIQLADQWMFTDYNMSFMLFFSQVVHGLGKDWERVPFKRRRAKGGLNH